MAQRKPALLPCLRHWERNANQDTSCEIGVTRDGVRFGKQALRIARVWGKNRSQAGIRSTGRIPVDPGATYLFSFWHRTTGTEYALPFMASVRVHRKSHEPLLFKRRKISSSSEWRQVYLLIDAAYMVETSSRGVFITGWHRQSRPVTLRIL